MIEWRGAGYQINKGHGWYEPKDPSKACRIDHGYVRISKKNWDGLGGFANPKLCRVTRNGKWAYYSKP